MPVGCVKSVMCTIYVRQFREKSIFVCLFSRLVIFKNIRNWWWLSWYDNVNYDGLSLNRLDPTLKGLTYEKAVLARPIGPYASVPYVYGTSFLMEQNGKVSSSQDIQLSLLAYSNFRSRDFIYYASSSSDEYYCYSVTNNKLSHFCFRFRFSNVLVT